jgi:hypothetical protein
MKQIALTTALIGALALPLAAPPAFAQTTETPKEDGLDGFGQFSEGLRQMLDSLTDELAPLMRQLSEQIDDLSAYEAPEILPNGDIIIRRKPKEPEPETPQAEPDPDTGAVEL